MLVEVARLEDIEVVTPLLIGGYAGEAEARISGVRVVECLRSQSIKGLWRWWFRAYATGALLGAHNDRTAVKRAEDVERGVLGSTETASRLVLKVRASCEKLVGSLTHRARYPRLKLLLLKRQSISCIKPGKLDAGIAVYERVFKGSRLQQDLRELALRSLCSALLFSGLGKGGRRGFGCLDFAVTTREVDLGFRDSSGLSTEAVKKFIEDTMLCARRALGVTSEREVDLAPIPSMVKGAARVFYVEQKREVGIDYFLVDLQGFTLRAQRERVLGRDPLREQRMAWILGMAEARGIIKGGRLVHGYRIEDREAARRASPLFIAVHKGYALITIFRSRDWPREISWKGGTPDLRASIQVPRVLSDAYELLEGVLKDYLKALGYRFTQLL